jgi:hypothetical protein
MLQQKRSIAMRRIFRNAPAQSEAHEVLLERRDQWETQDAMMRFTLPGSHLVQGG